MPILFLAFIVALLIGFQNMLIAFGVLIAGLFFLGITNSIINIIRNDSL